MTRFAEAGKVLEGPGLEASRNIQKIPGHEPISILEAGTEISFFQSHVRDRNGNFFLSILCYKTRMKISFFNLGLRDENENQD